MNDIDQRTRAALRCNAAGDSLASEINVAEQTFTAFRGRHGWLSKLLLAVSLVAFVALVFAVTRFYDSANVAMELRWGGLALSLMLMVVVTMLKIWFWLEMHTNPAAPLP